MNAVAASYNAAASCSKLRAGGFRGDAETQGWSERQDLCRGLRNQEAEPIGQRLVAAFIQQRRVRGAWPQPDIARRGSAVDQAIPQGLAMERGLHARDRVLECFRLARQEIDRRELEPGG